MRRDCVKRGVAFSPFFALRLFGCAATGVKTGKELELCPLFRHNHAFFDGNEAGIGLARRNGHALPYQLRRDNRVAALGHESHRDGETMSLPCTRHSRAVCEIEN